MHQCRGQSFAETGFRLFSCGSDLGLFPHQCCVWHAGIAVMPILLLNKNGIANWRVAISYYVQPKVGVE
jgi:hypothetical protein